MDRGPLRRLEEAGDGGRVACKTRLARPRAVKSRTVPIREFPSRLGVEDGHLARAALFDAESHEAWAARCWSDADKPLQLDSLTKTSIE